MLKINCWLILSTLIFLNLCGLLYPIQYLLSQKSLLLEFGYYYLIVVSLSLFFQKIYTSVFFCNLFYLLSFF